MKPLSIYEVTDGESGFFLPCFHIQQYQQGDFMKEELTVSQVADICNCHFNTVKNYTNRGYIQALRDNNNFRRYSLAEALKLKEILEIRMRGQND